jgi:hypothetical protein
VGTANPIRTTGPTLADTPFQAYTRRKDGADEADIVQADVDTIELTVTDEDGAVTIDALDIDPATVIYDTPQTGDIWEQGGVGFNFDHTCPGEAFPVSGKYDVAYWCVLTGGERFRLAWFEHTANAS